MILQVLKEKTLAQHQQLESNSLLHQLTSTDLSLTTYITILNKFYGFFSPLEALVSQYSPETYLHDFAERRKAGYLLSDLEKIDKSYQKQDVALCTSLPSVNNIDSAMGALYVMEGSTLGGQIISRHVAKSLNLTPENGTAFFHGYGKDTGKRWKKFQEALQQHCAEGGDSQQVISTSQETFSKLNHWLSI